MKITKSQLQLLVRSEYKSILAEERSGSDAWSENSADCDKEFFGILLGYLGDDAQSAGEFCKIAMSSEPGQGMDRALHDFNISSDAGFELLRAYGHIFGEDDPEFGAEKFMREGKKTMKITKRDLDNLILREIKIALMKSPGGCMGEELVGHEDDVDMPAPTGGDSHTLGPVPNAITQNRSGMGSISEDWEEEVDPHDAPPLGAITGRRGAPGLDIEEVEYWIQQVQGMPDGPEKANMLDLIQKELFRG